MQTTFIPDVYNKVINALRHNHPEYVDNINELAKLWKENLIKGDITLTGKLIETEVDSQNSIVSLDDTVGETKHIPYVLLDSFKRVRLQTKEDCRPPKRFMISIPIPQYDGSNGMPSDDEEVDNNTNSDNEEDKEHNDSVLSDSGSSNDEHDDETFISSNVVVCQYSQLTRRIHKWKMKLSKGVCYINDKNYVFGSCKADIHID